MGEPNPQAFVTFGALLKHLRQRARLTQDELGLAVGYSRAHVARLENNQRNPDPDAIKARFFESLGIRPDSAAAARLVELAAPARAMPLPTADDELGSSTSTMWRSLNNLPHQVTSFIGRAQALAELGRLLPTTRLLTLTGAGGVGKTRLALQLAERVLPDYPDGVWLIELASLSDPALVPQTIMTTLNLRAAHERGPVFTLIQHFQDKRALLLLDNCEHVIAACAQLADVLARGCRHLQILSTSREALGIAGELSWHVPSLQLPNAQAVMTVEELQHCEAIALFVERAAFVSPNFKLAVKNASAVQHICRRLDGIPLAIELVAARVKAFTPESIAERLDDRFRLLTGGSRTALPRQQTLQATIDWSYRLLLEHERIVLGRLAVFAGGWTLEAAEHVCADEAINCAEVIELLSRLVDKSLVTVDDAGTQTRYRLLEMIRQYAIEKLNDERESEVRLTRDRHLDYYLMLCRRVFVELNGLQAKDQAKFIKQLGLDADNVRQAIRWAFDTNCAERAGVLILGFRLLFTTHAVIDEMLGWLLMVAANDEVATRIRADALLVVADAYLMLGKFDEGLMVIERMRVIGASWNDAHILTNAAISKFWNALARREFSKARASFEESLALFNSLHLDPPDKPKPQALGLMELEAQIVGMNAMLALLEGDYQQAIAGNRTFHAHLSGAGNKVTSSSVARRLGYAHLLSGDLNNAAIYFRESLLDNLDLDDTLAISACLFAFATMAERTGDTLKAALLFGAATQVMSSTGLPTQPWDTQLYERALAAVQAQLNQPEIAAAWAEGSKMTFEQAMAYALETT